VLALAATYPFASFLQRAIFVLFWPAVIGSAWYGGLGPAILASALGVLSVDYFLVGTPGQLVPASADDLIPFGVFLFTSAAVSSLVNIARSARRAAAKTAMQNAELANELELQAIELEQQLEESQSLSEELEQSTEELAGRTSAAEAAEHFTAGILGSITYPFVVHDADWRFRFINDAAAEVFRQSPRASHEPPIGRVLWEAYPDVVGTVFEREMRRAVTERRPVTFEAYYAGRGAWSALSCFPLADGGLATQWIDITDRKRAEEAEQCLVRASEVLGSSLDYETTLDQLAHVVVPSIADWCSVHVVDENGTARQLSIVHTDPQKVAWARELEERYPQRADAPAGVPNVLRTGQPEMYEEISDAMLVAGTTDAEHLRIVRELGLESAMIVPLMSGARAVGALALVSAGSGRRYSARDLPLATELARRAAVAVEHAHLHRQAVEARERAERLLRVTESLAAASSEAQIARVVLSNLEAVLEPSRVAIYHVVRGDGGLAELQLIDGVGLTREDERLIGRFPLDGDSPVAIVARTGQSVFLADHNGFTARFPHFSRDRRVPGTSAWAGLALTASTGTSIGMVALGFLGERQFSDDVRRYVGAIIDQAAQALERVRLMKAEQFAREAAEEANRAKTQFLATMSHELRTPLNAISGYAELLSLGLRGPTTAEQQEDLGRIMRSQRHLLSVINDILNFARLEAGYVEYRVTNVPVTELLADLESLIKPQLAAKQLDFSSDQVAGDLIARADVEKVRQVLLNLLANAVKFTSPGGRIHIECHHDDTRVYIRVTDTGIGIPDDRRGAIFEPFVQLHRTLAQPAEGTGLGLAISRDLARGMGGELTVESEPGTGSTFTLALALASVVEPSIDSVVIPGVSEGPGLGPR
jgi:signal transduction histidine kinase/PAS domain-containing protein